MMSSPTNPPVRGEVRKPVFFQPQVATGRSETEHVLSEHTYVPPVAVRWPLSLLACTYFVSTKHALAGGGKLGDSAKSR